MGTIQYAYEAFNAGEISPQLYGRTNKGLEPRNRALRTALNMQVLVEGPAVRRGGTEFVREVKDSSKAARIVRFEFSETQAYALEFGEYVMRVYRDGGIIASGSGSPVEATTPWPASAVGDLRFTQSADVLFVSHPDYKPRTITRSSHTAWTVEEYDHEDGPYLDENTTSTYTLQLGATTGSNVSLTAAGYASGGAGPFASTDVGRMVRVKPSTEWAWGTIVTYSNASLVYVDLDSNAGSTAATANWRLGAWSDTTGWPRCSTIHQGRMVWAATDLEPQTFWGTRSGDYYDFAPTETDGSVVDSNGLTLTLGSAEVNTIRGLVSSNYLVLLTIGGEWRVVTPSGESLTATNGTARQDSSIGCANVQPVRFGSDTLFVQRHGKKVYGVRYSYEADALVPSYMNQLSRTITGDGITEMAYSREPDVGLWCVREDGRLLLMTYDPIQRVVGWTQHLVGGSYGTGDAVVESVAVIPGDGRDELWMIVKRTINGSTVRYVERMSAYLEYEDTAQEDVVYVDSAVSCDCRNTTSTAYFTLTSGASWAVGGTASLTASGHAPLTSGSVGYVYALQGPSGASYDLLERAYQVQITAVTTSNAATVELLDAIPAALQSNATANWARQTIEVTGASHLVGETASILADGAVQPDAVVTSGGGVTLKYRASVVCLGLKYPSYMCPARPDASFQYGTSQGRYKKITSAFVRVWRSLGFKAGKDLNNLRYVQGRSPSTPMDTPEPLFSGDISADKAVDMGWSLNADLYIYTDQPLPLQVQGIYAELSST